MKYLITNFLLFIFLATPLSSQCLYQAYEGFSGDIGNAIEGQSSGTGWAAPWLVQNNDMVVPGFQISDNSLTYNDLQNLYHKLSGGRAYLSMGRRLNTADTGPFNLLVAQNQNGIGTQIGDTLWVSFLIRKDQNNNERLAFDLHQSNLPWYWNPVTEDNIGIGYFGDQYHINGQRRWHLRINNIYYDSGIDVQINSTYLMVFRLIYTAGNTEVNLYINPDNLGNQLPGVPVLSQNSGRQNVIRSMSVFLGDQVGNGSIDEIRFASSYACVTPDAEVLVNLPPVASITADINSGQRPLNVNFNGTASTDPESQLLTYYWNFGDGSPVISGSPNVSHIFTALGVHPVSLTVTDNLGLQHTTYFSVTVLDENNTFPCQTSLTPIRSVSCGQSNGQIRVNAGNNNISLYNSANILLPIVNGNEYHNLAPDRYKLFVSGTIAPFCRDTLEVFMQIDSTTCQGWQPQTCVMDIGTNMSGFADWQFERPMKNLFKHIREDYIGYGATCFCWSSNVAGQLSMDSNGYPTHVPQTTTVGETYVRYVISSEGGNLTMDTTYVLLYDGEGTISFGGSIMITSNVANRIVFTPTANGNININITASTLGNHVRNIRIVKMQDELIDLVSQPFYQTFEDKVAPFQVLRFMDWGNTNGNTNVDWTNRSKISYFTYAGPKGVPYETMIQLCNETQKDLWICVPHEANDEYILQMATLFRDHLDGNLNIYLEYSNEIWNWIFPQAHYNNNNRPANLGYGRAMAEKAGNVFRIWHEVFDNERCRVKRVLGIQVGFNGLNEQILSQLPQDEWDYASPTHYFGLDHGATGMPRLDILGNSATVDDIMANAANSFNAFKPAVKRDYELIKLFGKRIITYEGGQHFVGNSFGIPYPYQQAMWDAQNTQLMYDMYDMMHDSIRSWGCELATNFSLASVQESVYGSWGIIPDIDVQPPYMTTAKKYQAVLDNGLSSACRNQIKWSGTSDNNWNNPCNWDKTRVPDHNSDVSIQAETPFHPIVSINTSVQSVTLQLNAILNILTGVVFEVQNE